MAEILECEEMLFRLLGSAPHGPDAENQQGLYPCSLYAVFLALFCFTSAVEMAKPAAGLACELPVLLLSSGDSKLRY